MGRTAGSSVSCCFSPRRSIHRPAGHRHSQADAPGGIRLERDRLRRHRVLVSARVRCRPGGVRTCDGQARRQYRLRHRDRDVEPGGDGARRGDADRPSGRRGAGGARLDVQRVGRRIHDGAVRPRTRRSRQFPRLHQVGRGVVSETGARVRHRPVQLRNERRRARHAADRPLDHADVGMVLGVHRHRRDWIRVAGAVVGATIIPTGIPG